MKLLNPGHVIDGFEIQECLHAGGMAHIYTVQYAVGEGGERRESEFPMAMKIPRMTAGDGAENIVSFEVEHQILPAISGANVPRFVAAGDLSRTPYLVMEYVQGSTLETWADKRHFSQACTIAHWPEWGQSWHMLCTACTNKMCVT
jgi:serine/threonine protein kinase